LSHALEQTYAPDANGRFALCGLPLGAYTVLAWDDADLDGRPGADEPFALGGATLTDAAPVAALHLALPAPRTYPPLAVR
jgi:hypothetical protein